MRVSLQWSRGRGFAVTVVCVGGPGAGVRRAEVGGCGGPEGDCGWPTARGGQCAVVQTCVDQVSVCR